MSKKRVFGGGRGRGDVLVEFDSSHSAKVGNVFAEVEGTEVFEGDNLF